MQSQATHVIDQNNAAPPSPPSLPPPPDTHTQDTPACKPPDRPQATLAEENAKELPPK